LFHRGETTAELHDLVEERDPLGRIPFMSRDEHRSQIQVERSLRDARRTVGRAR
jgi:hypothetical protein